LSANETGSTGYITVGYAGTDPFALQSLNQDRDGSGSFTSADLNAEVVVDSTFTANPTSNQVSSVISGVTLNLAGAGTATLGVQRDTAKVQAQAQTFVDAYNNLHQTLMSLESGTLQGDTTVLSIENRIRSILNTPPSGISSSWSYLAEIGVSLQKDGTMALDATTFQAALTTDFSGVANLFGNDNQGYAFRLQDAANQLVQTGGPLDARTDGLNSRLDTVQSRIDDMTYRLTKIQANYQKQYTALDTLMGTLQTTSTYLTQQLANLKLG
jgi:flagellar hook-associated protein 2